MAKSHMIKGNEFMQELEDFNNLLKQPPILIKHDGVMLELESVDKSKQCNLESFTWVCVPSSIDYDFVLVTYDQIYNIIEDDPSKIQDYILQKDTITFIETSDKLLMEVGYLKDVYLGGISIEEQNVFVNDFYKIYKKYEQNGN